VGLVLSHAMSPSKGMVEGPSQLQLVIFVHRAAYSKLAGAALRGWTWYDKIGTSEVPG